MLEMRGEKTERNTITLAIINILFCSSANFSHRGGRPMNFGSRNHKEPIIPTY